MRQAGWMHRDGSSRSSCRRRTLLLGSVNLLHCIPRTHVRACYETRPDLDRHVYTQSDRTLHFCP